MARTKPADEFEAELWAQVHRNRRMTVQNMRDIGEGLAESPDEFTADEVHRFRQAAADLLAACDAWLA